MKQKKTANKMASVSVAARKRRAVKKHPTVGKQIIEGLEQAVAWTRGDNHRARVSLAHVPDVDVREVRQKMGLSQAHLPRSLVSRQRLFPFGSRPRASR